MANFRDQLNAYGKRNDPAMARDANANEYADLPNPRRAQEIVDEARQRLAANGGKASMLPAMIQRVTAEFAQRDQQAQRSRGGANYVQPNNMEAYIDKVLQMSGMVGDPNVQMSAGGDGGEETQGAPVGEVERGGPLPDAEPNPANDADAGAEADPDSMMEEFAALAAAGGTAYAAYQMYKKYGKRVDSNGQTIIDNPDADARARTEAAAAANADGKGAVDDMIDAIDGTDGKQARIEGPNRPLLEGQRDALPAPQKQLEGPQSPTDESIDRTMTQEDIDRVFQDRVEGRAGSEAMPGPNRFGDTTADPIDEAIRAWQNGDVDTAVRILRENNIPPQSLRDRLGAVSGAAGKAAGRAVRGVL